MITRGPRKSYKTKKLTVYRAPVAFPRVKISRHKYVEAFTLPAGSSAGVLNSYSFNANDIYDPNASGTGHQPMYHDQMALFYQYYTVIASFIKVTFDQQNVSQNNYGIILSQDSSLNVDPTVILEQYGGTKPLISSQRNSPLSLRKSFDAKRIFKSTFKSLMGDDAQRVTVGGSPGTKIKYFFTVWAGPMDPTVTMASHKCQVEISYVVAWREPKDATPS